MKRLSPQKRNQLVGVIIAVVALICAVYFILIGPQNQKNKDLAANISKENARLADMKNLIAKQRDTASNSVVDLAQQLQHMETDVASGDPAAWSFNTIRMFKANYHLDIVNIGQPVLGDCDLLADFPYRQIRFTLTGAGYYHDVGKFVADFENKFPHSRVLNLALEPGGIIASTVIPSTNSVSDSPGASTALNEILSFRMDIIALVKGNN